jgi:microcystin degradation protein MlrC
MTQKRIALCGFNLESNRFAPTCTRRDFEENMYLRGVDITHEARAPQPRIHLSMCGFFTAMDMSCGGTQGWIPCPTVLIGSTPAGAVDEEFFLEFLDELRAALDELGPVDGVYICQHGGAIATHTHDPDGDIFQLVREVVGCNVPVVATLDLHANVSGAMVEATDLLVAYRTNPHIDLFERGEEAAHGLLKLFAGVKPHCHRVRLPLVAPSVTQLTAPGHPYGDVIRFGQTKLDDDVLNISILGGFAFSDTPKNGMTILVTTCGDAERARQLAVEIATVAWRDRHRYKPDMLPLAQAVDLARQAGSDKTVAPLLFADPADNPGGGGRGNTTYILDAFLNAGITGCAMAVFYDRAAVRAAFDVGIGGNLSITLNNDEDSALSHPLAVSATVESLSDGLFIGAFGMVKGKTVDTGPSAVLDLGGIRLVLISNRQQCLSSDYLSAFGIDPASCRCIVVKSRGHFRAGFEHLFNSSCIHEIDVPGLTSPNLHDFDWHYLPRPVYPIDEQVSWSPEIH